MPIWKLKEFWTIVIDLLVSAALYFGGKYLGESTFADLKWGIAALQPVALFLVAYFAVGRAQVETQRAIEQALYRAVTKAK